MQGFGLVSRSAIVLLCATSLAACGGTGPAGATGATGATGPTGPAGTGGSGGPSISGIIPNDVFVARTVEVTISGSNTAWDASTTVNFGGSDVTVNSLVVASPTALVANITVANTATLGPRTVKVTAGAATQAYTGAFTIASPIALTVQGNLAQGSIVDILVKNLDLQNPFDSTTDFSGNFTNLNLVLPTGMAVAVVNVTDFAAEVQIGIGVTAAAGSFVMDLQSGPPGGVVVDFPYAMPAVVARTAATLASGTAVNGSIAALDDSALYQITGGTAAIADFSVTTTSDTATPEVVVLPSSGLFSDLLASGTAVTVLSTTATPFYVVVLDDSSGVATYPFSVTATITAATYAAVSTTPTNTSSGAAESITLPSVIDEGVVPDGATNVWYVFTAAPGDVGKTVYVQLVGGNGEGGTDIEVDASDAATMLGATAGDGSTDLTTSPITAAGKIFVQFQPSQAGTYDPTMPNFDAVIRLQ